MVFIKWFMLKKPFWGLFQKKALLKCDYFHATSTMEKEEIKHLGFEQKTFISPELICLHI